MLYAPSLLPLPTTPAPINVPMIALLDWLGAHGLDYDLHEHPLAFTARETARVEGLDPHAFAKTLAVGRSDGRRALVVLEACDNVDLNAVSRLLDTDRVRLLTEVELLDLAPACDVGALPPIGDLFGVPVYADAALLDVERITFHAGSHRHAVRMGRRDWERTARVRYGDIAMTYEPLAAALSEWRWY
jgi:Ala-tRNA(Pro) deacylase